MAPGGDGIAAGERTEPVVQPIGWREIQPPYRCKPCPKCGATHNIVRSRLDKRSWGRPAMAQTYECAQCHNRDHVFFYVGARQR